MDVATEQQIGCVERMYNSPAGGDVAFSADGDLIILTDVSIGETKVWKTETLELVFHSSDSAACPQGLSEQEAVTVMHNCISKSSYMWPKFADKTCR